MKEIKAYIRRECLDRVVNALAHVPSLSGVSLSTVSGFGRSRGRLRFVDFETHIKIEIVCRDSLEPAVVEVIRRTGCTHQRGDGKIFVSSVEKAVRVEDGSQDEACV